MKGIWKWVLFGAIVFVAAFVIALPLFGGWMMPGRSLYGFGMMRAGMMGFGWGGLGLLLRFGIPLLLVIGAAVLVYSLVRGSGGSANAPQTPAPAPTVACVACGKPLDPGWVACPYCGKKQPK
jgi:hypothetical protein